jgi:tRNA uridine 5-carboxymethylaminomethyl modification enzyme
MNTKREQCNKTTTILQEMSVSPDQINGWLESKASSPIKQKTKLYQLLLRPELDLAQFMEIPSIATSLQSFHPEALMQAEISAKYEGYLAKEREMVEKMERLENLALRTDYNYDSILSLSAESREKLKRIKPVSVGQASRISGVTPADISILLVHIGR